MDRRLRQARTLLEHSRRRRDEAQARVGEAAEELGQLQKQRDQLRLATEALRVSHEAVTAGAVVSREEYGQALTRLEGEFAGQVEQGARRLVSQRREWRRAWRETEVWERLAGRLERAEARRVARGEQEQIDQQAKRRDHLGSGSIWDEKRAGYE